MSEDCKIDEKQMAADFDGVVLPPGGGPFTRARKLVEEHIETYGAVPGADRLRHGIGVELSLAEIKGVDRGRARRDLLKARIAELELQAAGSA